jgi:multidrug resistance efflux pump
MRLAQQSLKRLEGLNNIGGTQKKQVWQLQNDLEIHEQTASGLKHKLMFLGLAESQVEQLYQVDLQNSQTQSAISSTVPVRAPADGWLVGFDVVPGQVVQSQDKLFEIQDLSKVCARGFVFEGDAAKISVGQQARVT